MNNVLLSSKRHDWETPQAFFDELDRETDERRANMTAIIIITVIISTVVGVVWAHSIAEADPDEIEREREHETDLLTWRIHEDRYC